MSTLISECLNKSLSERNKLVIENSYLVSFIISRLTVKLPNSIDKNDLISTGTWGLLEAANRFNPNYDILFKSYAIKRIKGAIYDLLRSQSLGGQRICKLAKCIQKAISEIEKKQDGPANDTQIAKHLSMSVSDLQKHYAEINLSYVLHIEDQDSEESQLKHIGCDYASKPEDAYEKQALKQHVAAQVKSLPKHEKLVLSLYYEQELNLKEISYVLSVSESRVSQIRSKALLRLKSRLSD